MTDRPFTHPNAGHEVRVEQYGLKVCLIFVCGTQAMSDSLTEGIIKQLKGGSLNLTLMGKPDRIEEGFPQ